MCLETLEGFPVFLGENGRGLVGSYIVSSKAVSEDLNMKLSSKFNHDFTNRDCLHYAILKAYTAREPPMHFFFKMFKMRFQNFENV